MIKMGSHHDDYGNTMKAKILLDSDSTIVFNGRCSIASGYVLRVTCGGTLEIGSKVWFGENVAIDCSKSIIIGEGSGVTHDCFLSDSNHHFFIDADKNVRRMDGECRIGKYNWIGNNATLFKGTVTTDYTIVSQHSFLSKDYITLSGTSEPLTLAGSPAKIISKGAQRIFRGDYELEIHDYFNSHPEASTLKWSTPFDNQRL
jgi:acetyltransferase-like isoleucine patch superfamily enzyme